MMPQYVHQLAGGGLVPQSRAGCGAAATAYSKAGVLLDGLQHAATEHCSLFPARDPVK